MSFFTNKILSETAKNSKPTQKKRFVILRQQTFCESTSVGDTFCKQQCRDCIFYFIRQFNGYFWVTIVTSSRSGYAQIVLVTNEISLRGGVSSVLVNQHIAARTALIRKPKRSTEPFCRENNHTAKPFCLSLFYFIKHGPTRTLVNPYSLNLNACRTTFKNTIYAICLCRGWLYFSTMMMTPFWNTEHFDLWSFFNNLHCSSNQKTSVINLSQ